MNLLEAAKAAIIEAHTFALAPANHSPCKIELTDEFNILGAPEGIYDRWDMTFMPPNNIVTLRLWDGDELRSALQLNGLGQWKGRDRRGNGTVQMIATGRPAIWKLLANPGAWAKSQVKPKEEGTLGVNVKDPNRYGPPPPPIDWTPHEYNLAAALDRKTLVQNDTAVALIAYNRPTYFEQVVKSLVKNEIIKTMPIYLFMDQVAKEDLKDPLEGTPDYWEKQAAIVREYLPQTVIVRRPRNFGCGRNIIDARFQLFTNMKYDRVFVFEDDMTVSPDYMQMTINLLDWAEKNYTNVGAVQSWNKSHMGKSAKEKIHGETHATYTNWWGYLQTRESWAAMEPAMLAYQETFLGGRYSLRQHRAIAAHFREVRAENSPPILGDNRYALDETSRVVAEKYHNAPPTGQDAATMTYFEMAGYVRLAMSVNRGLYIGREGIHMTPAMFDRHGMHLVDLYELPGDEDRTDFWRRGDQVIQEQDDEDETSMDSNVRDMEFIDNV